jgi:hypothetical protein
MSNGLIHIGDCPTFRDTIKDQDGAIVDVSGASTKQMIFRKPGNVAMVKTLSFPSGGDGTDGKVEWTATTNDLDTSGDWQREDKIVIGSGTWRTVKKKFTVYDVLPES